MLSHIDIIGIAALIAVLFIIYATLVEPYRVQVSRLEIPIENLPTEFDGFTICQLSDMHLSRYGRLEKKVGELLSSLEYNTCVLTGDLTNTPEGLDAFHLIIDSTHASLGIFAVPGNGEYRLGLPIEEVAAEWEKMGITPLINSCAVLSRRGAKLSIIGVGDPFTECDDIEKATSGIEAGSNSVLLAHSPDILMRLGDFRPDLILAGHTHGGQVRLPCLPPLWLHCRHRLGISNGLYDPAELSRRSGVDMRGVRMYVSRGISATFPRLRFFCPPELVIITLASVSDA